MVRKNLTTRSTRMEINFLYGKLFTVLYIIRLNFLVLDMYKTLLLGNLCEACTRNKNQDIQLIYVSNTLSCILLFLDEFRSKMACENEIVQLGCGPNSRIAVYSASFGRTEYESVTCPQPPGIPEESEYSII